MKNLRNKQTGKQSCKRRNSDKNTNIHRRTSNSLQIIRKHRSHKRHSQTVEEHHVTEHSSSSREFWRFVFYYLIHNRIDKMYNRLIIPENEMEIKP